MNISALVIDDEEVSTFITTKVLNMFGVNDVVAFNDPGEALDYLKAEDDMPDIILLDLFFPVMDGFEFLDELEKLQLPDKTIRVFMVSVSINPEDKIKAIDKGCVAYIEKPFTLEKIQEMMQ